MIVTLLGPHGVGKSTLCQRLFLELKHRRYCVKLLHLYCERQHYFIIRYVAKMFGKLKVISSLRSSQISGRKQSLGRSWQLYNLVKAIAILFDKILILTISKMRFENCIIIVDEFPYDNVIDFHCLGCFPKWAMRWFFRVKVFSPDIAVVLDASPGVLFDRRPEFWECPKCEPEKWRAVYKALALGNHYLTILTEESVQKTWKELWAYLAEQLSCLQHASKEECEI